MFFKEVLENEKSYHIKTVLKEQKKKYDQLKVQCFSNFLGACVKNNEVVLPPDALIHGTKFNENVLSGIKKEGILASEFAKFEADAYDETFYMADFFKNVTGQNMPVAELLNSISHEKVISYLPNIKNAKDTPKLAFIVNSQDKAVVNYLELDLFSDNNSELLSFIDEEMFFSIPRRRRMQQYNYKLGQSSIPIGVPYSALSGVIIDKTLQENENGELDFIKNLFGKELFIISIEGSILHSPTLEEKKEMIL
ncbi:MAG: hypothetical protein CVV59_00415 [Tenericutes bacterium HGW-Tenericutes-4]|nr:MAG: hypothetical protein CVV59_00415 [Tenericutes bacterium HGW-Tenericutes-4]